MASRYIVAAALDETTKRLIADAAKEEDRTVSDYVRRVLKQHISGKASDKH